MIVETERGGERYVVAYGVMCRASDAAWQILFSPDGPAIWVPKSQCSIEYLPDKGSDCVAVEMPRWLAREKGMLQ